MIRQEVGPVSPRAEVISLSIRRKKIPELADFFEVSCAPVRFWIHRFNAYGPAGLYDQERSGRPRKVTPEVKEDTHKESYLATFWMVEMLVSAVSNRLKVTLSLGALRGALHQLGLRWGRPRLRMPNKADPEKAQKQWAIAKTVVEAPQNAAILYGDEPRIQLLPLIRVMWHWAGQQIRVPTPGTNVTRILFGALNIRTGQWAHLLRERIFKEDLVAFLEHLLIVYPGGPIILMVDNFSSRTARLVREWLEKHARLQSYYLPRYCSHLNPIEGIWL
jgi:transposase